MGYNYGHGDPPYYVSAGQAQTDDPVMTAYVGLAHHTDECTMATPRSRRAHDWVSRSAATAG